MIINFSDSNFEEYISSGKPVVIDTFAQWCGPCKKIGPYIEQLAEEYDNVIVGKADVDECYTITEKFGIRNVPTVLYIKDGKVVDKAVGALSKSVYEEKIKKIV
jgi:thioredoxin 1